MMLYWFVYKQFKVFPALAKNRKKILILIEKRTKMRFLKNSIFMPLQTQGSESEKRKSTEFGRKRQGLDSEIGVGDYFTKGVTRGGGGWFRGLLLLLKFDRIFLIKNFP